VEVAIRADPDCWLIEVADNGLGIEADYIAEIFKPLFRLHTASEYAGSGLGLTLARKAILAQNGGIWCESTPGAGSVFHIHLPLAKPIGARRIRRRAHKPV
jgi:signal transduction histidine kinase